VADDPATDPNALRRGSPLTPEIVEEVEEVTSELWASQARAGEPGRAGARRVTSALDRLLDSIATSVVERPLDVRSVEEAAAAIEAMASNLSSKAGSAWAMWAVARMRRVLVRKWRFTPSGTMITAGVSVLTSVTCGAAELRVLGSFLVHRLREAGIPVTARLVRRITLTLYLDPHATAGSVEPNRLGGARLLGRWSKDALPVWNHKRALRRGVRAAEAIDRLDLAAVAATLPALPPATPRALGASSLPDGNANDVR